MNARLKLRLLKARPRPALATWGPLSAPVDPLQTWQIARAQSLLSPTPKGGACPPLSHDQARDVLRWAGELTP